MERYEQIAVVGEGSYGVVMKCRHRDSDQVVAVKKFLETEEDNAVRKMALREIRMLKKLKHENLVTLIDVFRHRKRFYLVFEYLQGTVLDEIEKNNGGIGEEKTRERIYQVLRAIAYCHANNIVHRDIKPENILISNQGVVKLCDFGFARIMSFTMELCTEYVATRWYRAPELLVGEPQYGSAIDIWATGCLFAEMLTGEPLFPGDSDIDQLFLILKCIGKPCSRHQFLMSKNSQLRGMAKCSSQNDYAGLQKICRNWPQVSVDFLISCLEMDPLVRPPSAELLKHHYFAHDNFPQRFLPALRERVNVEFNSNPLLRKFKAEVLLSTDKSKPSEEKGSSRRSISSTVGEPLRWKMNLIEGGFKRKFSCENSDYSLTGGRKSYREKTGITFLKSTKSVISVNESDVTLLGKSMENMTARSDVAQDAVNITPSFALKANCNSQVIRKSPTLLQNITQPPFKNVFAQQLANIPISSKAYNTASSKKAERHTLHDLFINIEPLHLGPSSLANNNGNAKKVNSKSKIKDDFTLPNLPGATTSPKESKTSKLNVTPESCSSILTPRIMSASESPKHVLPMM